MRSCFNSLYLFVHLPCISYNFILILSMRSVLFSSKVYTSCIPWILHNPIHFSLQNWCPPLWELLRTYFQEVMAYCFWRRKVHFQMRFTIVLHVLKALKKCSSNKSNLGRWGTHSWLMFWNKSFKATAWTICEIIQWSYGEPWKLKAFLCENYCSAISGEVSVRWVSFGVTLVPVFV